MSVEHAVAAVQLKIRKKPPVERVVDKLKAERVELKLQEAPPWWMTSDGGSLRRVKKFSGLAEALLYLSFLRTLASFLEVPVKVSRKRSRVVIHLRGDMTSEGYGPLSDKQLHFARLVS